MKRRTFQSRVLSLTIVVALLCLRLGSFSDATFVTPVEDAIFDRAFIAEENPEEGKSLKAKPKLIFELPLQAGAELLPPVGTPRQPGTFLPPALILRDVVPEIFIPPETLC